MYRLRAAALALVGVLATAAAWQSPALAADPTLEPGFPVRAHSDAGTFAAGPATAISVGDIDGDQRPEIVASAAAWGPLYAWHGDGSRVEGWPSNETQGVVYPGLGELSRRTPGFEIAAGAWGDPVLAWESTGEVLSGWPLPSSNYIQSPPTLADVNGDGLDEIFINQSSGGLSGFSAAGDHLPNWPQNTTRPTFGEEITPAVVDLDKDGTKEIVSVAGSSYDAYVFVRAADGTSKPGFPLHIADRGPVRASPAVGDVDGDGALEIVAPYIAPGPAAALAVVSASGTVERRLVSGTRVGDPGPLAPVLADLTADGVPEILLQDESRVDAWSGKDGSELPGWPVVGGDEWSNQSPVVGDVDGDQDPDVIVQSMRAGDAQGGLLRAYDKSGALLPGFPKEPPFGTGDLTPAIADIDGDGRNEIVVAGFEGPYSGEWPYVWAYDLGGANHGPIEWGQYGGGPRHQGWYGQQTTPPLPPAPSATPEGKAGPADRVVDLRAGAAGSKPRHPVLLGDALLLSADDGAVGAELFATDGTAAGTHLVRDIRTGAAGSDPTELVRAGDKVFFSAATAGEGRELWVTDGTAGGTTLVKDIWPGAAGSEPHHMTAVGSAVFFSAWDGVHGFELWRSDGTAAGTKMVDDSLVATSEPTGAASGGAPTILTPFGGGLAYAVGYVDENQNGGRYVMRTDAAGGTPWTFGYRKFSAGLSPYHSGDLADAAGTLFMHDGSLLMRSQGTTETWQALYDDNFYALGSFTVLGGNVLFPATGDDGTGRELWRLGPTGRPQRVANIAASWESSAPQELTHYGTGIAFRARTLESGAELWRTDGTSVTQIADIYSGARGSDPARLLTLGDDLVFTADDGLHGHELWRSTGSAAGTHLLADVAPGPRSAGVTWIRRVGDRLVFDADDGATGSELWSIPLPLPLPDPPPVPDPPPPPPAGGDGGSTPPADDGSAPPAGGESTLLGATAQPTLTAPAAVETVTAQTPTGGSGDRLAPRLTRLALKRVRGRPYLTLRLSETAVVKVIAQRRVRGHWRTVRLDVTRRCARGSNRIGVASLLRAARSPAHLMVSATDKYGNRSKLALLRVR